MAELLEDETRFGEFPMYGLSAFPYMREGFRESHQYLKALALGEKLMTCRSRDMPVCGFALPSEKPGLHEKAILFGKRARKIAESLVSDQSLFFKPGGMGFNYFFMEKPRKAELGKTF
ncbi:MAG: hypothetical protein R2860_11285 [Desulfobacterales bacterium]